MAHKKFDFKQNQQIDNKLQIEVIKEIKQNKS